MKKYIRFSGLAVMYIGVILLIVGYAFSWTDSNAFIISTVALMVLGVAWHVYLLKKESKY